MADTDNRRLALLALAVAICAGSIASILIRWSAAPKATQVFYRLLFTTAGVAPIALVRHRADFRNVLPRDLGVSLVTGVLLGVHFLLFFNSLDWTTVAAATTLTQTHALMVPVGAYFVLDEGVTRQMVAGIAIAVAGVLLLSTGGMLTQSLLAGSRPLYGNAIAVLAAVGFTFYALAGRSVRQRLSLFPYVTLVYGMATVAVGIYAGVVGAPIVHPFPLAEWGIFLGLAIGPGLLCHTLLNWSLEHVEASVGSAAFLGIPVVSTALAVVLLDEVASWITVVACGIILTGIYLAATGAPDGG